MILGVPYSDNLKKISENNQNMVDGLSSVMSTLKEGKPPNDEGGTYSSPTLKAKAQRLTPGRFCQEIFGTDNYFFDNDEIYSSIRSDGEYDGETDGENIFKDGENSVLDFIDLDRTLFTENPFSSDQLFPYKES